MRKTVKRGLCMTLCAAMLAAEPGAWAGAAGMTQLVMAAEKSVLDNGSFSKGTDGWFATSMPNGATLEAVNDGKGHDGDGYVKVVGRTDTWNSLAQTINTKVKKGYRYNFSCWVKLGEEYTAESTVKVGLSIQSTGDNGGEYSYDGWGLNGNTVTASKDEWRQIQGSFVANWSGELKDLQFKVADETCLNSFYVDDITLEEEEISYEIEQSIPSLKEFFVQKNKNYDFKVGAAMTADLLENKGKMELVAKHYNSLTAGNEMKPDYIIKGVDKNGELILDFTIPDKILQTIWDYNKTAAKEDQIQMRGHVLCWHSQTPECFFKDANGRLLDKDAMNKRLESYIKQVTEHVQTKYPGLVYCWDVVNEAIQPSDGEVGGLRVVNGEVETFYHQIYGSSNEYIVNAFKYANKYVDPSVKLFYNDYGETDPVKVKAICDLVDDIKKHEGTRIDGIGMQGHYSMESPSASELYTAITTYAKHVDEVQITELDMLASKSYDGSDANKEAELTKQAYRYKEIMDTVLKAKDQGANITAVVFWGVADDDSWLLSPQFSQGRHNMPLLFDETLKAKTAYWGIVDPSKLLPFINEENVVYSDAKDWSLASDIAIGTDENAFMKLLWKDGKLIARVTVKDSSKNKNDAVTFYYDLNNKKANNKSGIKKITVKRSQGKAIKGGYVVEKAIKIGKKGVNSQIGFDVVIKDGKTGKKQCWNDLQMKQEKRSKYYGTLTLKPFVNIKKGSAVIDGKIDAIWKNVEAQKLTVKSAKTDTSATVKTLWDKNYIYVLAEVKDACLNKDNANTWEQDSLEIFVDENNGKTDSYETDDCQYRINYANEQSFNGTNCNSNNIKSKTKVTKNGYIVEARIKRNTVKGKAKQLIGIDFQINDADASGARVATINWYDASGMGYAKPSVYGTAKLDAVSAKKK